MNKPRKGFFPSNELRDPQSIRLWKAEKMGRLRGANRETGAPASLVSGVPFYGAEMCTCCVKAL